MPWIKETAECWLQVETACLSFHLHIPMHTNSPCNKLSWQQVKPVPCPHHHPKMPTGSCLFDLSHALWVRRFELFAVHCNGISQSCSPCPGAEWEDLSRALPAAGTSQSTWIIKQWSFLPCLCIPNTCRSERKGKKFVWTVQVFTEKVLYQQNNNYQWERIATVFYSICPTAFVLLERNA